MNILVTGASGYIGFVLINKLLLTNHNIVGIDKVNHATNLNNIYPAYRFVQGELTDKGVVDEVCKNIDCVIHLAGEANIRATKQLLIKNNIDSSKVLIQSALENKINQFIYLSSTKSGLTNEYGRSKEEAEKRIIESMTDAQIDYTILQSTSVYGKGMKNGLAKWLRLYKYPLFPRLPKSSSQLEMIGIDDLCEIILSILDRTETKNKIFKINDGCIYTIDDIDEVCKKTFQNKFISFRMPKIILSFLAGISVILKYFGINIAYDMDVHKQMFLGKASIQSTQYDEIGYIPKQSFYTELPAILNQEQM